MPHDFENRLSAGLIITAVMASLVLMLHHPTSFQGPDDGMFLNDWGNTLVHGAMMICLFVFRFAFRTWARRLGLNHPSVRAGALAFDSGMSAFIVAALVTGFAAAGLVSGEAGPNDALRAMGALNNALASFGLVATAAAMALWAVRMVRWTMVARIAGIFGVVAFLTAVGWVIVGGGAFGLHPAMAAAFLFGAWSLLVASQMMKADQSGELK